MARCLPRLVMLTVAWQTKGMNHLRVACLAWLVLSLSCARTLPAQQPSVSTSRAPEPTATPEIAAETVLPNEAEAADEHAVQPGTVAAEPHAHEPSSSQHGYHMDFSRTRHFASHFDDAKRDAWQKPAEVVALLALAPGQVVADLGAGTGYFEPYLSRAVGEEGHVLALDAEKNMVDYLAKRTEQAGLTNVEAREVPYDDPQLKDSSVDRILIVNTWHHIDARTAYAAKLQRALKPGGFVLIVDFTRASDIGPPLKHRLTPEQVAQELSAGGLQAEVAQEALPKQYVVIGRQPQTPEDRQAGKSSARRFEVRGLPCFGSSTGLSPRQPPKPKPQTEAG